MLYHTLRSLFLSQGLPGAAWVIGRRLTGRPAAISRHITPCVSGKRGIEIGGPSNVFSRRGLTPIYPHAQKMDNCNFSTRTIWEGSLKDESPYQCDPHLPQGIQFIREATDLHGIASDSYDFLCSSHMLEHSANPLRALAEWRRVLRPKGTLILILPHRDGAFDRHRPLTPFTHLQQDFEHNTPESDATHLQEIKELTDRKICPQPVFRAGIFDDPRENMQYRSAHHHVFDCRLAIETLIAAQFQVEALQAVRPFHIIAVARKIESPQPPHWRDHFRSLAMQSPFPSDQQLWDR